MDSKMLTLVACLLLAFSSLSQAKLTKTDKDVLNFALNLEYLEANFYSCAVYGWPLTSEQRGGGPAPMGCMKSDISATVYPYAVKIAADELAHVLLIQSVLGKKAVAQPAIDLTQFATAASVGYNLYTNQTLVGNFTYMSNYGFLLSAFIFEDVGVTAYLGAAPLVSKAVLPAAGAIMAVEAYHGGILRSMLIRYANETVPGFAFNVGTAGNVITNLRQVLSGKDVDEVPVVSSNGTYNPVPTDVNGLVYSRTYCQVLDIVYFGNAAKGGFFPNGLNGAFKSC